jgi:hypothetical protein
VLVLVLDLINPENVDDDENEGGSPMGSLVIVLVLAAALAPCGGLSPMTNLAPLRPKRVPPRDR